MHGVGDPRAPGSLLRLRAPSAARLCVSGRAGLSLPLPQDPKSSPALRGLSTAQCPQEASQGDRFTPPRTVWPGWPAPKCPHLQRGPKRPPAWAAAPIHRSPESSGDLCSCFCCSPLPNPSSSRPPPTTSLHGAVCSLLTRLPPQPLSQIPADGGPTWTFPINPLPARTSQEPALDRAWPLGTVRQVSWAPLRTLNMPAA